MKKNIFIMTIRKEYQNRQMKLTVERGRCMVREFMLYPYSDIMTSEKVVSQKNFMRIVTANMAANLDGSAVVNVYFNGNNYRMYLDGAI